MSDPVLPCRSTVDLENAKFRKDVDGNVCANVCKSVDISDLMNLSTIVGFTSGETFDEMQAGINSTGQQILEFILGSVCQFQLVFTLTSSTSFNILKQDCTGRLLQEDGFAILQEDGSNLLAQGLLNA